MPTIHLTVVRRSFWRTTALCLAAVVAQACGREREAPDPAASGAAPEVVPPPPPTASSFTVPLEYDFSPILPEVERAVPMKFGSLDTLRQLGNDTRKHYAFEVTRGRFTAVMDGPEVRLSSTLSYAVRGRYNPPVGPTLSAGCGKGDERPKIVLELVTPLTLSPNWRLQSQVRLARLEPASDSVSDRCRVSILRYDVTDRVLDAARKALTDQLPEVDRKIAGIDVTEHATRWWGELNRPIRLTEGVWLLLQPRQLRAGRVSGEGHRLTLQAGLDAFPKVVTGAEPDPTSQPLPPLARNTRSTGFRILLDGNVDYATASREVTEALRGTSVSQAGRSVAVESVTVSPERAGRLALTVKFTGDASGTLRFVGTPQYDPVRGQVVVPDLDYDLETDSRLIAAFAWLRSDALRALFRQKARVPVEPVLERGRALLTKGLNRTIGGAVTMSATVDSVTVQGLYVTAPALVVRAGAAGSARVSIRQKG